jgi:ubiquinone/menaquinone biosynthesis C-methylase UbiE
MSTMKLKPVCPGSAPACIGAECDFVNEYEIVQSPLMQEIEQCMRGIAYGGTSWTTRTQAEATATRLGLGSGRRLLDLGSGSGWPSLFFAKLTGCEVVATDLPLTGLRVAKARVAHDGLDDRCSVLAADGTALPFADGSFDHVHHADVLCCMLPKREMLQECHRVTRANATMEFSVIALTRELADDHERAVLEKSGPPYPDAGSDYATLLAEACWDVLERIDVTAEFARCMDVQLREFAARRDALVQLLGEEDYADRVERRVSTRAAVSRGMLKREIFLARHP